MARQTGKKKEKLEQVGKKYKSTQAIEFDTPKGKRWYKGTGESADMQLSRNKARFDALARIASNPSDSIRTKGVVPSFDKPAAKVKKKKYFWQK